VFPPSVGKKFSTAEVVEAWWEAKRLSAGSDGKCKREGRRFKRRTVTGLQVQDSPGYQHTLIWTNPGIPDPSKKQRFDRYPGSSFRDLAAQVFTS
jgi:hypothetical protein